MAPFSHPSLIALSAVLEDAAGILQVPVEEISVELLEARVWPDTGLGLNGAGGRALTPGYQIRLGNGITYRADQKGHVACEPDTTDRPTDTEIRLRYTQEGGIAGGQTSFETDSTQLSEEDEAELRRLVAEADFFNVGNAIPDHIVYDGITTRLWIAVGRRNHEVVRGDGIDVQNTEAFHALVAWAVERTSPGSPRISTQLE